MFGNLFMPHNSHNTASLLRYRHMGQTRSRIMNLSISDLDRVAITLSTIAYLSVGASHEERFKAMAKALQISELPTRQQWGLVWGPHEFHQSLVFIAQ